MASLRILGRRVSRTGATFVVLGLVAIAAWSFAITWRPADRDYAFQGFDVSEAEGPVQWPTVLAGGADFAYLRATMGATGRDAQFPNSWADAYAAGMRRGATHVWSFCRLAIDQANNFNTTVPRVGDALPAAIYLAFSDDCPQRPEREIVINELKRFIVMVEAHTGKPVLLKIAQPVEVTYRISAAIPRPIWSQQNFFPPNYAVRPWRMWQASDMRRIDGVEGPVHWDVVSP